MTDFDPNAGPDPPRPGCEPAQAALQRLLDHDSAWDSPEAAAHRAACIACREELILARSMAGAFPAAVVPAELAAKILGASTAAHRRRRVQRYAGLAGALAACVLVAIGIFRPSPQAITERPSVASVTRAKDDEAPTKPLGEAVSEARDALVSLTRRTATETQQTSASLIPNPKLPDMPDTGDGLEPLADAQAGAARSVDPIKTSARRAINLFMRAADPPNKPAVQ
jgi:hypothetical protein